MSYDIKDIALNYALRLKNYENADQLVEAACKIETFINSADFSSSVDAGKIEVAAPPANGVVVPGVSAGAARTDLAAQPAKLPTKKAVAEAAVEFGKVRGRDTLLAILATFGVDKVPKLADEQRVPFLNALEAAVGAAAVAAEVAGEAPVAIAEPAAPVVADSVFTLQQVVARLIEVAEGGKTADVMAALKAQGVVKATELKPEQYPAFMQALA